MQQENPTRTSSANISAAIVAANAGTHPTLHSPLHSSGDAARSLADMAQIDLDAALQLLADRAQYITGANGAAIALRRGGKNDMQCRATTGSNAPELGALLSTEFGISGESVRTRQALRCDDAERDPRVNREGCRELGIASVVVMPVVNDDEVLGVFELFSGKINAFGERDLSALQRLSEMVETAVKLARAAEDVPGLLAELPIRTNDEADTGVFVAGEFVADEEADEPVLEVEAPSGIPAEPLLVTAQAEAAFLVNDAPSPHSELTSPPLAEVETPTVAGAQPVKKPLFWSAAMASAGDGQPAEPDRSHVPPVLRNLRTCEVCGFPVSPGRALCVECEEKRWRGQLRRPSTPLPTLGEKKAAPATAAPAAASAPVARLVAAAAASSASAASVSSPLVIEPPKAMDVQVKASAAVAASAPSVAKPVPPADLPVPIVAPEPAAKTSEVPPPTFVLSAAQPSQSWISSYKYILGALLVVAGAVAAILFLR